MTIDVEFGSPLPPIEIVGDRFRLRPFRSDDLPVVEEASRDDLIPSMTSVPREWTSQLGLAFIDR